MVNVTISTSRQHQLWQNNNNRRLSEWQVAALTLDLDRRGFDQWAFESWIARLASQLFAIVFSFGQQLQFGRCRASIRRVIRFHLCVLFHFSPISKLVSSFFLNSIFSVLRYERKSGSVYTRCTHEGRIIEFLSFFFFLSSTSTAYNSMMKPDQTISSFV